jgi:hypothetical protein
MITSSTRSFSTNRRSCSARPRSSRSRRRSAARRADVVSRAHALGDSGRVLVLRRRCLVGSAPAPSRAGRPWRAVACAEARLDSTVSALTIFDTRAAVCHVASTGLEPASHCAPRGCGSEGKTCGDLALESMLLAPDRSVGRSRACPLERERERESVAPAPLSRGWRRDIVDR